MAITVLPPYSDPIGVWESALRDWLPPVLFDAHVHLGPPEAVGPVSAERRKEGLLAWTHLGWEELEGFYGRLFPGRRIAGAFAFPFPQREVDLDAANDYLVGVMRREPRVRGFLLAHPTEAHPSIACYQRALAAGVRFRGVKPYFDRVGKSNYQCTMPEFIPEGLLEFMDAEGLLMMLHTSGIGVGDPANRAYLRRLAVRYPNVRVILAHLGRYLQPEQFLAFLDSGLLEECPTLFLEISTGSVSALYQRILERRHLWPRLLFGTDVPWGVTPFVECFSPEQEWRVIVGRRGEPPAEADAGDAQQRRLTYNTYHCLWALKHAFEAIGIQGETGQALKQAIFLENARRLQGWSDGVTE